MAVRCVVEVGGHGDHGAVHLEVELAFLPEILGAPLQLSQDEGRDLRRRLLALADADAHHPAGLAADAEWQQLSFAADVVDAAAHEALHGIDGAVGLGQQPALRLAADVDRAIGGERDHRQHQAVAGTSRITTGVPSLT